MITVIIDGKNIQVDTGKTILDAAREAGIYIPTLCYLEHINPLGSCRLCLVEVEGLAEPVTACTTPATDGMKVKTQSDNLQQLRKRALQLMLADHPLDCPVCDKAGECRLQDLTYEMGIAEKEYTLKNTDFRIDYHSPLIERYESRCVRCGRCVSVCTEIQGVGAYIHRDKGYQMRIDTVDGGPLNCDFCGQCILVCPVGALINKRFKYQCRAWQLEETASVCPFCAAGCRVSLDVFRDKVQRIRPAVDEVTEVGKICGRPVFGYEFIHQADRLSEPMIRKGGKLTPVSWDEALDYAAQRLQAVKTAAGGRAIAGIGSVRASNEDNYLFQELFRQVLASPNLDSANGPGYGQAVATLMEATGQVKPSFSREDIEKADLVMVIGCDLAAELPVPSLEVIRAARDGQTQLVNALPFGNKLDRFAHLRLRHKPGTELELLAGLSKLVVEKQAVRYQPALKEEKFIRSLKDISLEKVVQATGIDLEQLTQAAGMLAKAGKIIFITGYYLVSGPAVKEAVSALTNLALMLDAGVSIVPEKNNQFGALAMGVAPDWLPGFKRADKQPDTDWRQALQKGDIKALYLMGADPLTGFVGGASLEEALSKLDLLIVQDVFPTRAMQFAHIVLPATTFAEKAGTFINAWGQVQAINPAIPPIGGARPDWQIIAALAAKLGAAMPYTRAGQISEEIATVFPGFPQDPVYPQETRHTFFPIVLPGREKEKESPFCLLIGPTLFHSGTLSTHSQGLLTLAAGEILEMNPEDMAALQVAATDPVNILAAGFSFQVKITSSPRLPRGTVFLPVNFGGIVARFPAETYPLARVRIERC